MPVYVFNLVFELQGSGRESGIGIVTAEGQHHRTDPTKKITREQEGNEAYIRSLMYLRLCAFMHVGFCVFYMCICACFETQKR